MKSFLTVQITFSYQGVTYNPLVNIELDRFLEKSEEIPEFYQIVAKENNIDSYSYEYEVMQLGQIKYLEATGLAKEFCSEDDFDMAGFKLRWKQQYIEQKLAAIAFEHMNIVDFDNNEPLKQALLQAYQLGSAEG
jgi:hypothetical protein